MAPNRREKAMKAIEILMDEHQTILRVLAATEALLTGPAGEAEPFETFARIPRFLQEYADRLHHAKEEDLLFPALEANGLNPEYGPTAAMRFEHEQGRALVRRMLEQTGSEEGFDRQAFAEPALEFVALLRSHIGKEDYVLYPMAERAIPAAEWVALEARYAEADAASLPRQQIEDYERWAVDLARRLGVDQDRFDQKPSCHV